MRKAMAGSLTLAGSVTGMPGQKVARYAAARAIIGGLASAKCEGVVKSGLLKMSEGIECFVFITEDHGNGKLTIILFLKLRTQAPAWCRSFPRH